MIEHFFTAPCSMKDEQDIIRQSEEMTDTR